MTMRSWRWSETLLLQTLLLLVILGAGFIVSPFVNYHRSDHHSGRLMLQWREATPEEDLLWQLQRQQEEASR